MSDPAKISYEDARAELRDVVARLEGGGQSLEDSLALWERGEFLADVCQRWLDEASERLEQAISAHDGSAHDGDPGTSGGPGEPAPPAERPEADTNA